MKKIGIIGSGITGLTIGKLFLNDNRFNVRILEKESKVGGIAKTKNVDGVAYHTVGGHCLNSKNKAIMDFIFSEVLEKEKWHKVNRVAKIFIKDHFISYPIEFSVKEITKFDKEFAYNITKDFLSSDETNGSNLADWFRGKFGKTLAEEYFIPYNRKIWQMEPSSMSYKWVDGKLPTPNKIDFFNSLIEDNTQDEMPHNSFYYPNSNDQNTMINALAEGQEITTNFEVVSIEKLESSWLVNNELEFDILINTSPLDKLILNIMNVPFEIIEAAKKLKYNKVTNMLWKTKNVDYTWSYYPEEKTIFHRHIHIGNFHLPKQNYTITESVGEHSYEEMVTAGNKFDYLLEPVSYNVSDYAYVVYDQYHAQATSKIKTYLKEINLESVGRFGEWEYYNMDICMESAMKLVNKIIKAS